MPSKEGKTWRGVVWLDGKRVSQKRGFSRKSDALEWERVEKKRLIDLSESQQLGTDLMTFCTDYCDFAERFTKKVYKEKRSLCKRIMSIGDYTP